MLLQVPATITLDEMNALTRSILSFVSDYGASNRLLSDIEHPLTPPLPLEPLPQ